MPWLLDPSRPNLHWRVLTDLIHRPPDSRAVTSARGGADAVDPIATLLEDLSPDGAWVRTTPLWEKFAGPGWRLLAAVQWGGDPTDPRLQGASLQPTASPASSPAARISSLRSMANPPSRSEPHLSPTQPQMA